MGTLLPLCNEVKSLTQRKRRRSSTFITVIVLVLFYLWNTSDPSGYGEGGVPTRFHALLSKKDPTGSLIGKPIDFCSVDMDRLSIYNLTRQFQYSQRYVQQTPLTAQRRLELQDGNNPADNLDGELFPLTTVIGAEQAVKVNGSMTVQLNECSTDIVPLHVKHDLDSLAADMPEDMSHLMFGVASNAERLLEAKDHFGFWLGHTGAEIILAVPESPFIPLLKYEYEQRGINVRIIVSDLDFLKTYFKLTVWLDEHKSANTKWVTIIDDDTVYFSLRRFNKMLEKYDAKGDWYIGAPSEDSWQMMRSGFFGFGGAGVTLSVPLLQKMLPFYDECLGYEKIEINDPELGGDLRLARCITRNTEARFTIETDLHQVDLRGDVRGVLQGPRVPINWHHYHSHMWGGLDILKFADSTPFCQADCLFQRWKFRSTKTNPETQEALQSTSVLHLGHSFVRYKDGIDPELRRYELTWVRKPLSIYDHSFEPLRRPYVEGDERHSYIFEGGYWADDGSFIQTYIKRAVPLSGEMDAVVELIWR